MLFFRKVRNRLLVCRTGLFSCGNMGHLSYLKLANTTTQTVRVPKALINDS